MTDNRIIWQPDAARMASTAMHGFLQASYCDHYAALHARSIADPAAFWGQLVEFCEVQFETQAATVLARPDDVLRGGWFPGATLNYAAHLLRHRGNGPAIIECCEDGSRSELDFDALRDRVAAVAAGLKRQGIGVGDRVAGFLPNCTDAVVAMLASASVGAIWSSCSPDFGADGVVDRFGQIEPRLLFTADGYRYNGKTHSSLPTAAEIAARIDSIERVVVVPYAATSADPADIDNAVPIDDFAIAGAALDFVAVPFSHPLFILYSSGTTGTPKCIVHGHGGVLLKHLSEQVLHSDVRPGDRLFYFTTCGWMMWNWLASGLASGATLVLFDGSPFHADGRVLWELAERERVSIFGTSAKYLSALEKAGLRPRDDFSIDALRVVLSTGSPLAPTGFDYVYSAIGSDLQLSSIAGGTDIIGCFVLGNPLLPVRRGEIQCRALGMAVEIYDDAGRPVEGGRGELVCTRPFPSTPVGFWNDPADERYRAAYFERFPGVWAHGDYAEITASGGAIIHGRSDAVLNPGGVRIGTAEIYRQVEKLDEVVESIAVGQRWDDDVRVVLFVVLRDGVELDDELIARIRRQIRANTTPRHVPSKVVAVNDIPRTKSGKIVEIAVRAVIHGEGVDNTDALANPQALDEYRDRAELATD